MVIYNIIGNIGATVICLHIFADAELTSKYNNNSSPSTLSAPCVAKWSAIFLSIKQCGGVQCTVTGLFAISAGRQREIKTD